MSVCHRDLPVRPTSAHHLSIGAHSRHRRHLGTPYEPHRRVPTGASPTRQPGPVRPRGAASTRHDLRAARRAEVEGALRRAGSLAVAIVVAMFFGMSPGLALLSATEGAVFGLFPIMWIVFTAIWLYQVTVVSGRFEDLRGAFHLISDDPRVQAIIIAFCFGGLLEALAGFGAPVAITGVMLMALGFSPVRAAIVVLLANTAPVAFGAIGTRSSPRALSPASPTPRSAPTSAGERPPCWPASSRCCWSSSSTAGVAYARPGQWLCRSASPSRSPSSRVICPWHVAPSGLIAGWSHSRCGRRRADPRPPNASPSSTCVERRLLHDAQLTSAESAPGCVPGSGPVLVAARGVDGLFRRRLRAGNVGSCRPHSTSARS